MVQQIENKENITWSDSCAAWYTKSKQITNYKLHSNVTRTCNQAAFNSNELKLDVLNHSNPCCLIQGTSTWHAFEAQQRVCESKDVTIRGFSRVSLECAKIFHMPVTFHLKAHMSKRATHKSAPISSEVEIELSTCYRAWVCHIHFHSITQQALTPVYYCFRSQYARVQLCEIQLAKQHEILK